MKIKAIIACTEYRTVWLSDGSESACYVIPSDASVADIEKEALSHWDAYQKGTEHLSLVKIEVVS